MSRSQRYGGAYCRPPSDHSSVEATVRDADGRQVGLEDLAVVADLRDDLQGEVGGDPEPRIEHLAIDVLATEELDLGGVGAGGVGGGGLRRDAELLGLDRGEDRPLHGLRPGCVTVDHGRRQRLLGEDVLEDDEGLGSVRVIGPARGELAAVARPSVALPGDERFLHEVDVVEGQHVDGQGRRAANSVATLPSVVVPAATQTLAPSMSSMLA